MDVNAAVAAAAAITGACVGVVAMLAFRFSERERSRPPRPAFHSASPLPPGVDTVLSVLRSSAVVLDEQDTVVKASSAAYAMGLVRGGRLTVERMLAMARETRRDGEIRQVELDLPRRGTGRGESLYVSARVAPLGSRLVLVLVEDMTEARRIEAIRRDFVANVSHELKTPAGALSLLSEAVLDAKDDPEAVQRFAYRMQAEATRLTGLIQELIELSRVQNDDALVDAEPVRVDELIAEALDRSAQRAANKEITMSVGGDTDLYVWGHRGQLTAALGNLVENAVNYSQSRTRVGVVARRSTEPDMIEIAVTDQGIGIAEKDRDRIFERFYRVDPARSRATGGTGLGLAIVKHVAASHGGEVTVWSVEGQGSTFTLRLPEAGSARRRQEQRLRGRERAGGALREPGDLDEDDDRFAPAPTGEQPGGGAAVELTPGEAGSAGGEGWDVADPEPHPDRPLEGPHDRPAQGDRADGRGARTSQMHTPASEVLP